MAVPQLDVIVTAATPAGVTVATLLARQGHRVRLYDAGTFEPPPVTDWVPATRDGVMAELGLLDQLGPAIEVSGFGPAHAIRRGPFDRLLLENARKHGVEVFVGVHVLDVLFEEDRAIGVSIIDTDCGADEVMARVVIDAIGPKPVLAKSQRILQEWNLGGQHAFWAYFSGVKSNAWPDAMGITQLPDHQTCAVLRSDPATFGVAKGDRETFFLAAMTHVRPFLESLKDATPVSEGNTSRGIDWRLSRHAGHGWMALWGAHGAYEPLVLPGIGRGLFAGSKAAQLVHAALKSGDVSAAVLAFDQAAHAITLFDALERGCA